MIDPEKLRKQIDEVWAALSHKSDSEGQGVMRACALTLIAVIDDDDNSGGVTETLAQLMPEHPSRAIVIRLAPDGRDLLEADVEAQCWMPFGGRQQICCEQIVIRCSEQTLGEVPGVVLPLLVADLPAVLWCASRRAWQSESFPLLAGMTQRVILDTFRFPVPAKALEALMAQLAAPGALVSDLSWTRLTRWRALVAQVFENEHCRRQIPYLRDLTIYYEGASMPPTALLMAGWVAQALGWDPKGGAGLHFRRSGKQDAGPRMTAVELQSERDPAMLLWIGRSAPAFGEVRLETAGLEPVMNRVALPPSNDLLLLEEELAIQAPDPIFERSLGWASRIARTLFEP